LYGRSFLIDVLFVGLTTTALYAVLARVADRVLTSALTVGDVAIYAGTTARLRTMLQSTVALIVGVRESMLYISTLDEFLRMEPRITQTAGLEPSPGPGAIEFQHVSFTYPGSEHPTLTDVSFQVEPGETVALVGENGAGKTTLAKLLARFYDPGPGQGRILVNGVDLRQLSPAHWHRQIGFVFQHIGQYEATAAENIAYGNWERLFQHKEMIERIARLANVHDTIIAMPRGYDTFLGRRFGEYDLSQGQWQQLAVARAFAREDASLLILDEPTSNLDARAEYELFCRFRELAAGRTTILISHRFSTVSMADRILVLSEGRIVEQGTHQDLLARGGYYASLYRLHERQAGVPPAGP
jgi:ATP-binding cassette subfamily B protein